MRRQFIIAITIAITHWVFWGDSFTQDTIPPAVTFTYPANGDTGVIHQAIIKACFSKKMKAGDFNNNTVKVSGSVTGEFAEVHIYYNTEMETLFAWTYDLFQGEETVEVVLSGNIRDIHWNTLDGNSNGAAEGSPTDDYVWTFEAKAYLGPPMQEGWPVSIGQAWSQSPTVGDLDDDGKMEIGFIDNGGLHIWRSDGSYLEGWPQYIPTVLHSPTFGDLDGDGDLEIIIGAKYGEFKVWHHDGTYVDGWPVRVSDEYYTGPYTGAAYPVLGDLDNDKLPEIIAVCCSCISHSAPIYIYAFEADGTVLTGFPIKIEGEGCGGTPAIGDLERDAKLDIVVPTFFEYEYGGAVWVFESNGSVKTGWPQRMPEGLISSPALADLNQDGYLEIVQSCLDGRVYVWDYQGNIVRGWPRPGSPQDWIFGSVALGDLDGDGSVDVAVATSDYAWLYVWKADGFPLPGFPIHIPPHVGGSPAIGDIDGDGDMEILVSSGNWFDINSYHYLYAFHHNGQPVEAFPLEMRFAGSSTPALADLDGDGDIEIIQNADDLRIYVWDCSAPYSKNRVEWGMFHHDMWHTGLYGFDPSVVGVSETHKEEPHGTSQNYPNPMSYLTEIEYQLPMDSYVIINIYNASGQLIRTLLNKKMKAGNHRITWDGKDNNQIKVPSGVYFYQIETDNYTSNKKIILLR